MGEAFFEWLRSGVRVARRTARCRRCGEPAGSVAALRPIPAGRRRRAPRRHRGIWPIQLAPWVWVAAAAIGIGLGIAADAAFGWPWWIFPPVVAGATWMGFSIPAIRRWGWGGPAGLAVGLLEAASPPLGWRREAALIRRMFERPPFPLYGLPPSWKGRRSSGGWGATMGRVNRISLVHGPGGDEGSLVVETWNAPPERILPLLRAEAAEEIAAEPGRGSSREREPASWDPITVRVDGQQLPFERLRRGDDWVTIGKVGTGVVIVQARRFRMDEVELVRVADTAPYVAGVPPSAPT